MLFSSQLFQWKHVYLLLIDITWLFNNVRFFLFRSMLVIWLRKWNWTYWLHLEDSFNLALQFFNVDFLKKCVSCLWFTCVVSLFSWKRRIRCKWSLVLYVPFRWRQYNKHVHFLIFSDWISDWRFSSIPFCLFNEWWWRITFTVQ